MWEIVFLSSVGSSIRAALCPVNTRLLLRRVSLFYSAHDEMTRVTSDLLLPSTPTDPITLSLIMRLEWPLVIGAHSPSLCERTSLKHTGRRFHARWSCAHAWRLPHQKNKKKKKKKTAPSSSECVVHRVSDGLYSFSKLRIGRIPQGVWGLSPPTTTC